LDYDALAAGLNQAIPFNGHLGLRVEEVAAGRGVVTLPEQLGPLTPLGRSATMTVRWHVRRNSA
jgi:acyl-coenzyme A thioesterase PaaI-like protein